MIQKINLLSIVLSIILLGGCGSQSEPDKQSPKLFVFATAYNSLPEQTTAVDPAVAAWGDTLKAGMKAIAVSRDLLKKGLTHNVRVRIEGLEGEYRVLDKMNKRWVQRIDIYMGEDLQAARQWGIKIVEITWMGH